MSGSIPSTEFSEISGNPSCTSSAVTPSISATCCSLPGKMQTDLESEGRWPVFRNSGDYSEKLRSDSQITALLPKQAAGKVRVVPTYPLLLGVKFWHGGRDHVSARQSQEKRWQAASLLQRGGEPSRGEEQDSATDGAVSRGNQRWPRSDLAQDAAGLRRESGAAHDAEFVPRGSRNSGTCQ